MESNRSEIIISNLLQDIFEKVFDNNYEEFYKYISLEIGISDDEIEYLKASGNFVKN